MRNHVLLELVITCAVLFGLVALLVGAAAKALRGAGEIVRESRSYWNWLDEYAPREDTAHYP